MTDQTKVGRAVTGTTLANRILDYLLSNVAPPVIPQTYLGVHRSAPNRDGVGGEITTAAQRVRAAWTVPVVGVIPGQRSATGGRLNDPSEGGTIVGSATPVETDDGDTAYVRMMPGDGVDIQVFDSLPATAARAVTVVIRTENPEVGSPRLVMDMFRLDGSQGQSYECFVPAGAAGQGYSEISMTLNGPPFTAANQADGRLHLLCGVSGLSAGNAVRITQINVRTPGTPQPGMESRNLAIALPAPADTTTTPPTAPTANPFTQPETITHVSVWAGNTPADICLFVLPLLDPVTGAAAPLPVAQNGSLMFRPADLVVACDVGTPTVDGPGGLAMTDYAEDLLLRYSLRAFVLAPSTAGNFAVNCELSPGNEPRADEDFSTGYLIVSQNANAVSFGAAASGQSSSSSEVEFRDLSARERFGVGGQIGDGSGVAAAIYLQSRSFVVLFGSLRQPVPFAKGDTVIIPAGDLTVAIQ